MSTSVAEARRFDWEKRYQHAAWKVIGPEMADRFSAALCEGGLLPQYRDDQEESPERPGIIFWWDRNLTSKESTIARRAMDLATGEAS